MNEGILRVNDRLSVYLRAWEPAGRPRGVVALVHGLGDHAGRWDHVGDFLAERGFLVLAPDLPGHGRNPGIRGHAGFPQIGGVISALLAEARRRAGPGRPVFLYGHSMGANRCLAWQIEHPDERIAGVVASSPSIGGPLPKPPAAKKALARVLAVLAPSVTMENGLELPSLCRDTAVVEAFRTDPLYHPNISARLAAGFLASWDWFARWPGGTFASPVLILQGTGDRCVEPEATLALARRLTGDVTLKTWDGFFHELHNEPERVEVLGFIAGWMEKRLA
jgi:acylglycerol lipase